MSVQPARAGHTPMRPTSGPRVRASHGFSLIELTIAASLLLVVTAGLFAMLDPARSALAASPEVADMHQRLRVVADVLSTDVLMAGAGPPGERRGGSLIYFFAPVLPYRSGSEGDSAGSFRTDALTVIYMPPVAAQGAVIGPLHGGTTSITIRCVAGSPSGDPLCGFRAGMTAAVFDESGSRELFRIESAVGAVLAVRREGESSGRTYGDGSRVAQVVSRAYFLKTDPSTQSTQLTSADAGGSAVPVADHVVGLGFEYAGDSMPPLVRGPDERADGPLTTYGPRPPGPDVRESDFPPGENCIFSRAAESGLSLPRLSTLGDISTPLVPLTRERLTDGPWCPDPASPQRFDADLLRVRRVGLRLRVQAASAALRGPVSTLFRYGGTARHADRLVPDVEWRFDLAPRNMQSWR